MIAAQHQRDDPAFRTVHQQHLDADLRAHFEKGAEFGDGVRVRRRHLGQGMPRGRARRGRDRAPRGFEIRGVVARGRKGDRVLARIGEHMKFLRDVAADAAAVRLHGAEFQPHSGEDSRVSGEHGAVAFRQARFVDVKRIGVFHQKFAGAHHAESGADFVTEFGLELVEIHGQLLVAAQFAPGDVGDHLFVRRPIDELAVVPVLEAQQFRSVFAPTARFLPKFSRLDGRHDHLQGACPVHFLPDNAFGLAQGAQSDGEPGIKAGRQTPDHAGAQHQAVADDLCVGRHVSERGNRVLG